MGVIVFFILVLITIGMYFLFSYMHGLAMSHHLSKETIKLPGKFGETNVLFITDIHFRTLDESLFTPYSTKIDMVWIGGDLVEKKVKKEALEHNLNVLSSLGPVYFVFGNNDYEWPESAFAELLDKYDVTVLHNRSIIFHRCWTLAGVDDFTNGEPDINKALSRTVGPTIVLSHNPEIAHDLGEYTDVHYIFSGHTHGGQIRLGPFGIAEKSGWAVKSNKRVFISSGFGTTQFPLRLGTKAEWHLITIKGDR
ncbi:metallophosphoesterase [Alteribacter aurantiacus]|uniref:metallophosphoesterase n=1 Tax=Alteribacter aurantiacus TaxID=254410 RepID=UPI0003F62482|nr:metallophosphoesterase [Alteribacter aurantiacus]